MEEFGGFGQVLKGIPGVKCQSVERERERGLDHLWSSRDGMCYLAEEKKGGRGGQIEDDTGPAEKEQTGQELVQSNLLFDQRQKRCIEGIGLLEFLDTLTLEDVHFGILMKRHQDQSEDLAKI